MYDIQIVEWNHQYAEDFISLSEEWLKKYVSIEPADIEIIYHPYETILNKGGMIFFAIIQDTPVGTVALIPKDDYFELAKLAVTQSYKKQGIGKRLMETAIQYSKKHNVHTMILYTNRKLIPAISLYKSFGFKEIPLKNNQYLEADMKMELQL